MLKTKNIEYIIYKFKNDFNLNKNDACFVNYGSFYRKDKNHTPKTKLKCIPISKKMGWCNDIKVIKKYNKLIKINKNISHEKMFRNDYKYDFIIPIKYNTNNTKLGKGSAIFIHLTKNYKPTAGCIAISKKDFLILLKIIDKKTKIKIN